MCSSTSHGLMDPRARGLRVTKNAYFSLFAHTKHFVIRLHELEVGRDPMTLDVVRRRRTLTPDADDERQWTDTNVEIVNNLQNLNVLSFFSIL